MWAIWSVRQAGLHRGSFSCDVGVAPVEEVVLHEVREDDRAGEISVRVLVVQKAMPPSSGRGLWPR